MKSTMSFASTAATNVLTPHSRRQFRPLSLRKGTQHGPATIALGPEVRLPVLPRNRDYLKALREAELVAWETARPVTFATAKPKPAPARLPAPAPEAGENRLYALLAVVSVLALGYHLRTLLLSANGWHDFVQFVRQFLT